MESRWSIALRPIKFSQILGQSHIINFFQRVLSDFYTNPNKKLPVGALFGGRSGVGKTTLARVIAASLNCPNRKGSVEPCGVCASCKSIRFGKSSDVLEIDASYFGLVDNVRDLRERLNSYSYQTYRVVILDECHMMSKEAFNVLLKMLEEPPEKVVFILVTTEVEKVLDTVRSRLVEFRFRIVVWSAVWKMASRILSRLHMTADEAALEKMYKISGYNVRDFFMSLEHLTKVCEGSITKAVIEENFGDVFVMDSILDAICAGNYESAVEQYERFASYEVDFDIFISRFLDFIIERLRDYLKKGGAETFLYASIVKIIYKFLQNKVRLKGVIAAKVLFFEIVSQLTKGDFGLKRESKKDKLVDGEEIFNILLTKKQD